MPGLPGCVVLAAIALSWVLGATGVSSATAASLTRELGAGVDVSRSDETGRVDFIATEPGSPIARPTGIATSDSPTDAARAFLADHRAAVGLGHAAIRRIRVVDGPGGITAIRFQQARAGIPVLGGELIVNVDDRNRIVSLSGEAGPATSEQTVPAVSPDDAIDLAVTLTAKGREAEPGELQTSNPELWIYDSRLLGGPGPDRPQLVWRTEVTNGPAGDIRELVLIDATTGAVALHFSEIAEGMNRAVCDANNTDSGLPCTSPMRSEGEGATGIAEVDDAYDFSGATYGFFLDVLGRDNLDGAGGPNPLKSTVRYCNPFRPCPYRNAFWNGDQVVFGEGYARADDVVAHELVHGYTEFTSRLFYYYQSGAINESMSDVFGEFVDLHQNVTSADTGGTKWLHGEDKPGGANRDMEDPGAFGQPDRMTSPSYFGGRADNGGVHFNSGVGNKAAFLMTDGGSFNGQTIAGLGIEKAARIYDTVQTTQLTSASDYADLGAALRQACANLIGIAGVTADDCEQVSKVVTATEMETDPPSAPAPDAPTCMTGVPTDFFADDMESASGWTARPESDGWIYSAFPYATSGVTALYGEDVPVIADRSVISPRMSIPARAFLRFAHSFNFEAYDFGPSGFLYADGGVVEYSLDDGSTWIDAGSLIVDNGYTGPIAPDFGNPLGGRNAFADISRGYISSRLDLGTLSGQDSVRFRFRLGSDDGVGSESGFFGWYVDDVRGYTCAAETSITSGPDEGSITADATPAFEFSSSEPSWTFECRVDAAAFSPCTSPHATEALTDGSHTFAVRATDGSGNADPTPAERSFAVAAVAPPPPPPADRIAPNTVITKAPPRRTDKHRARFAFESTEPGSTFGCLLDGAERACTNRLSVRVARGKHKLLVQATDAAGNEDSTAAVARWKVRGR